MEKISKFEEKLIKKMNGEKDEKVVAERAFRKAVNVIKQQISGLELKRVDFQIQQEEMKEKLDNASVCNNFSLIAYDKAKEDFDNSQEQLENVEKTIQARKDLLESWS